MSGWRTVRGDRSFRRPRFWNASSASGSRRFATWIMRGRSPIVFRGGVNPWWILAGGVILAGIGFQSVFDEERLVIDRRTKTLFLRRQLRRHVNWSFDEIATVELLKRARPDGAPPKPNSLKECRLLFKDGTRVRVFRGRVEDMDDMAAKLAEYTESPLEVGVL